MTTRASSDPDATCWRDGRTLTEHGPTQRWTCGHVDDPELYAQHPSPHATIIDGRLCAPEASRCNFSAGARAGNQQRAERNEPHSEDW